MGFIDAREAPDRSELEADVVIIGGGMAGATLARELAGTSLRVAVIESGGMEADPHVQELYRGTALMVRPDGSTAEVDKFMHETRMRLLGGSGNVWGGRCIPLDRADFTTRRGVAHSGWPFTRAQLQPYYDRACDRLSVPRFGAAPGTVEPRRPSYEISPDFTDLPGYWSRCSGRRDKALFDAFRTDYAKAANVTVWLNANVREIVLDAKTDQVSQLELATLNGRRHVARGRVYVLAIGGIENARLLLASNSVRREGLANRHDLVGRYFQGHLSYGANGEIPGVVTAAVFMGPPEKLSLYDNLGQGRLHCTFAAAGRLQQRLGTGSFDVTPYRNMRIKDDAAAAALVQLAGRLDAAAPRHHVVAFQAEHPPNPDSRITLANTSDALGMPRAHLNWAFPEAHWQTLERCIDAFARALGETGRGRLCWPVERPRYAEIAEWSRHHMGATRMHADPERGVVDPHGRAHDVGNLYVAGSSVFPTSGVANPTLTLIALAIRMADHLKSDLGAVA